VSKAHDDRTDRVARMNLLGWRGFPPPAWGQYNPNEITWRTVRSEILAEMVRWVLVTHGEERTHVDLFRDPVWAMYECLKCGERRCGFSSVAYAVHKKCGEVKCMKAGLTYTAARALHNSQQLPLGATVREELGLDVRERLECLARFWREVDRGRIPLRIDLTPGRNIRLLGGYDGS
jgi:hypothetical protein